MTSATKDVIEKKSIVLCDICGNEIDEADREANRDDYASATYLEGKKPPVTNAEKERAVKNPPKWFKFNWPSANVRNDENARRAVRGEPHVRTWDKNDLFHTRFYDFHADCLLNLVEAAIKLRTQREAEELE